MVIVHQPVVQAKPVRIKAMVTVPSPKGSAPEKKKCNSQWPKFPVRTKIVRVAVTVLSLVNDSLVLSVPLLECITGPKRWGHGTWPARRLGSTPLLPLRGAV